METAVAVEHQITIVFFPKLTVVGNRRFTTVLPAFHCNPFSFFQILIVEFAKSDRINNHAAIVRSGNGLLLCAPIYEKYDDFGTPDAAILVKKWGSDRAPLIRLVWQSR
jgi:hypothetical protein